MKLFYFVCLLFLNSLAMAQVDLNNGLIARFKFNGDATDASPNHYDGVLHGNATVNGKLRLGDNTSDYVSLPPAIMNNLGNFSVAFTIKFHKLHTTGNFPTNHYLTGSGASLDRIGFSYEKAMNSWRAVINGATSNNFFDDNVVAGTVYCVCIMRSGDTVSFYLNENLLGALTTNTTPLDISSLLIGQEEDCTADCFAQNQCMNGAMENLCFWNRVLNADEVNELCRLGENQFDLKNEVAENISIYPNPVTDYFEVSASVIAEIRVYDTSGRLISTQLNSNRVNVNALTSGIYIAHIVDESGKTNIIKFVKE